MTKPQKTAAATQKYPQGSPEANSLPFEQHYPSAVDGLVSSLSALLHSVGADPESPQVVSRTIGINRNLAWKISRLIGATDPYSIYPQIPGANALRILLEAYRKAGAPSEALAKVREAVEEFDRMVESHAGDRATLELMLDSLAPAGIQSEALEVSRKLAFRGNSGICGLQAKVRLRSIFLAPNPEDPSQIDLTQVSGLIRVRRFRPDAALPLFVRNSFSDDGSPLPERSEPISECPEGPEHSMLMPEFCSSPLPKIRVAPFDGGTFYQLAEGQIGNLGATTIVYGDIVRKFASRYRNEHNTWGELMTRVNAPVETLLVHVFYHRDLDEVRGLEARVYPGETGGIDLPRGSELECSEQIQSLGSGPPRTTSSLMPQHSQLTQTVFDRMNWDPSEFHGVRFERKHPPLNHTVVLRYRLPERRSTD